jgi:hypothetical protein
MASHRHLSSSALLVVLGFLLAAVPGLYLFQAMVFKAREHQQHMVANLVVRLNERTPHHLDLSLHPSASTAIQAGRVTLDGEGQLRGGTFPWKQVPIQARLELTLGAEALTGPSPPLRLGTGGQGLSARYQERYLGSGDAPMEPVPCIGTLEISKLDTARPLEDWEQVREVEGLLELQCHGSGRDLTQSTDDDLHFTLLGTVDYAFADPA